METPVIAVAGALLALAGCTAGQPAPGGSADAAPSEVAGTCDAAPAQPMVGTLVGAEAGARLLALTGARTLRWAPPDSALTMDFRPERLTVSYDRSMRITRIVCG
ncbi:MAG: hypothetical protein H5U21_10605 [Porphyrobacter sp.]|nr:hypothetical protein [Porphyrobacter sp.]